MSAVRAGAHLDDLGVDLEPARALGMRTVTVVDPGAAPAELSAVTGVPLAGQAAA